MPVDELFAGRLAEIATRELDALLPRHRPDRSDGGAEAGADRSGREDLVSAEPRDVVAALHRARSRWTCSERMSVADSPSCVTASDQWDVISRGRHHRDRRSPEGRGRQRIAASPSVSLRRGAHPDAST